VKIFKRNDPNISKNMENTEKYFRQKSIGAQMAKLIFKKSKSYKDHYFLNGII